MWRAICRTRCHVQLLLQTEVCVCVRASYTCVSLAALRVWVCVRSLICVCPRRQTRPQRRFPKIVGTDGERMNRGTCPDGLQTKTNRHEYKPRAIIYPKRKSIHPIILEKVVILVTLLFRIQRTRTSPWVIGPGPVTSPSPGWNQKQGVLPTRK